MHRSQTAAGVVDRYRSRGWRGEGATRHAPLRRRAPRAPGPRAPHRTHAPSPTGSATACVSLVNLMTLSNKVHVSPQTLTEIAVGISAVVSRLTKHQNVISKHLLYK